MEYFVLFTIALLIIGVCWRPTVELVAFVAILALITSSLHLVIDARAERAAKTEQSAAVCL